MYQIALQPRRLICILKCRRIAHSHTHAFFWEGGGGFKYCKKTKQLPGPKKLDFWPKLRNIQTFLFYPRYEAES